MTNPNTNFTVLIIEDDFEVRSLIYDTLEHEKYRVLEAEDGEVGLALIHQERPDIVLTDIRMPGIDGLDLIKAYRMIDKYVPIIAISGDPTSEQPAIKVGATKFLHKPVRPDILLGLIASIISEKAH